MNKKQLASTTGPYERETQYGRTLKEKDTPLKQNKTGVVTKTTDWGSLRYTYNGAPASDGLRK